jgi:hypothetical protein
MSALEKIPVSVELSARVAPLIRHTLRLLENHFEVRFYEVPTGGLSISDKRPADIRISEKLISAIDNRKFAHEMLMEDEPLIRCADGNPDYLGTCAYMANLLQEYVANSECFDDLDRFRYRCSYQYKFGCVEENLVLQYLIRLQQECAKLQHLRRKTFQSTLWISHDIDYLFHTIWPELKTAIRNFRIDHILRLLLWESFKDRDRKIFRKILTLHETYGIKATFFWIANQKKYQTSSGRIIENANYDIGDKKVKQYLRQIKEYQHELGVHQSLGCRNPVKERDQIDPSITINRNHYLAGRLPELWRSLEGTGINRDATAGFSEVMGFRNSYGLPLQPYDILRNRPFEITAYPLHIMDATFINQNKPASEAQTEILNFLSRNRTDCKISLLWHNNYFSEIKFEEWVKIYHKSLVFSKDENLITEFF